MSMQNNKYNSCEIFSAGIFEIVFFNMEVDKINNYENIK